MSQQTLPIFDPVDEVINRLADQAHEELRAMYLFAVRSNGQRIRYAREELHQFLGDAR